jgi:hypothetical protein
VVAADEARGLEEDVNLCSDEEGFFLRGVQFVEFHHFGEEEGSILVGKFLEFFNGELFSVEQEVSSGCVETHTGESSTEGYRVGHVFKERLVRIVGCKKRKKKKVKVFPGQNRKGKTIKLLFAIYHAPSRDKSFVFLVCGVII